MTTLTQDVQAITLTPTALAKGQAGGADLSGLMAQLQNHIAEKQRLIKEIIRLHPVAQALMVCGGVVISAAAKRRTDFSG